MPDANTDALSEAVDIGIVTGTGSARNAIKVLSGDVFVTCGFDGSATASEIALKSGKSVILLKVRAESCAFFAAIGDSGGHAADSVDETIGLTRRLLVAD